MKISRVIVTISFMLLILVENALSTTYYVRQSDGSDSYNGLSSSYQSGTNGPWKTIQKAASTMVAGDTVLIRTGTYRETVVPSNSGTSTNKITYKAYTGESPIISGADLFVPYNSSWTVFNGSIYQCNTQQSFEQLFVDGTMMNEARWPNCAVEQMVWQPRSTTNVYTNIYGLGDSSLPAPLYGESWVGAKVWITSGWQWAPFVKTISSYTAGSLLGFGDTDWINSWYYPTAGNYYFIFGSLAGLDTNSEWVQKSNLMCYLWTPNNASPATHTIEVKQRADGFMIYTKNWIVVDGLRFFACRYYTNGTYNTVQNCKFKYLNHMRSYTTYGGTWLSGQNTNCLTGSNNTFQSNWVYIAAASGVFNDGTNNVITNNRFYETGYHVGAMAVGIGSNSSSGYTTWNTVEQSGRCGIEGYPYQMSITNNSVHDVMQLTRDGGAFYSTNKSAAGTVIANNMFYNVTGQNAVGVGLYLDQYSTGFICHHNKIWSCTDSAIRMNSPSEYNYIYNNTCADGTRSLGFAVVGSNPNSMNGTAIQNNIFNGTVETSNVYPPYYTNNVYSTAFDNWLFPSVGSPAYDGGTPITGYTCTGDNNPDCGAFNHTQCDYWTCGSSLAASWW